MVKNDDFNYKFENKLVPPMAKRDTKEMSVWKLPDNVSKPDFRHWLDSVDI